MAEDNLIDAKLDLPQAESLPARVRRRERTGVSRRRTAILEATAASAEGLMNPNEPEKGINAFLARVGQAAEADRAYIFENQTDGTRTPLTSRKYGWLASDDLSSPTTPEIWDFLLLDVGLQRWVEKLGSNQSIHGPVRCFPPNERRFLVAQNIRSILITPIHVEGTWWGFIGLDNCAAEREWTTVEIDAVSIAARVIGAALANAQLHHDTQIRALQLETLRDVSRNIGGVLDQDAVLRLTLEQICKLVGAPRGAAYLADPSAGVTIRHALVGLSGPAALCPPTLPLKNSLTGQVIITGRPIFIEKGSPETPERGGKRQALLLPENIQSELPMQSNDVNEHGVGAKAAAFIPLPVGAHVLGTLVLAFDQPRAFYDGERRLLAAVGEQAGMVLANARLFQETVTAERQARRRADQLTALHEMSRIVNASLDLNQTLSLLLEQLVILVPYDSAAVFLHEGETLRMAAARGFPDAVPGAQLDLTTRENPLLTQVVETGKPLMLTDAQQDERFPSWKSAQHVRGWIAAPLLLGTELVGILTINHHQPGAFDDESTRLAQALADQTAVAIYKARLMDDLQHANLELRRLDELKDQFIQNVAHELRTPLTLVRGYVELLAQENLDLKTQNEAIQTALNHTETLVQLVEAITTLQDLSLEGLTLDPIDLTELIATAHQLASQKALRAGIELRTDWPAKLPAFAGDFIWLSQALYHLLDNAIKFSPPGGCVTLEVRDDIDAQELHFSVEDHGIGVPTDEQQRIFELFYQADGTTTRRFGGTGLGLAIVQHVVQAHSGRVWVESPIQEDEDELGPGSRFSIRLPRNNKQPLPNAPV